ncbi:arfaptin-1 isoform X1 [Astyanax mexicanus]|uniref:arfaptin-1 isoform X1 n=2 Tax=Astyanax mexicanus TaxID=7994 RepID=UPI0020CB6628|nr:arfaptin-1 isoform X1 [Astyanax mexicanus]XP_022537755.2 arfaptin-1 isoform X1 [Astyanax mexicanus]
MSEASFESQENVSEKDRSDPEEEEGPETSSQSISQPEETPNSLSDEAHMTEIDISDSSEARGLEGSHAEREADNAEQAQRYNSGAHKDAEDQANSKIPSTEASKDVMPTQTGIKVGSSSGWITRIRSRLSSSNVAMAEEAHRSPAAELSVTSNGDADTGHEEVFQRDLSLGVSSGPITSNMHSAPDNYGMMSEGVVEVGPQNSGSRSQPTSPTSPTVAPSPAAASRLARTVSESEVEREKGDVRGQPRSRSVVLADDMKSPAMEKLELVRKWSINTYKCTKQILSEKLGRGSRTVDLELEAQIEILRDNKRKYEHVVKLAQTLATQLGQMMQTQRQLGDAFADLSLKSPELHEEFGYNAETQKLLSKNGETLLGAIQFFIASVNTLVDKTIEDTLINIKQYEAARIEYDAYRTDLEELNLGPRDATTLPKIEQSQIQFQMHREKYEKMRNDVSVKLKFLEENKVKVLHNQLILFHNGIAAYFAGNQQHLEQTLKQFHIKLKMPGADTPSWLEEH